MEKDSSKKPSSGPTGRLRRRLKTAKLTDPGSKKPSSSTSGSRRPAAGLAHRPKPAKAAADKFYRSLAGSEYNKVTKLQSESASVELWNKLAVEDMREVKSDAPSVAFKFPFTPLKEHGLQPRGFDAGTIFNPTHSPSVDAEEEEGFFYENICMIRNNHGDSKTQLNTVKNITKYFTEIYAAEPTSASSDMQTEPVKQFSDEIWNQIIKDLKSSFNKDYSNLITEILDNDKDVDQYKIHFPHEMRQGLSTSPIAPGADVSPVNADAIATFENIL